MEYTADRFRNEILQAIAETGLLEPGDIELQVPTAPNVDADLSLSTFKAAKTQKLNPVQLAQQLGSALGDKFSSNSLISGVEVIGPFLNFKANLPILVRQVVGEIEAHGERYGWDDAGVGKTIVVDYSSPNVAKRMHIGHIRSTIIGQALVNIYRAMRWNVAGDNHLGDWGKQFGTLIAAIERWGKPEGEGEAIIAQLEDLYSRYSKLAGQDPALDQEARNWSLRLEQGDVNATEIWQQIVSLTAIANQRNYDRLGVRFDTEHGESFYSFMTDEVLSDALNAGLAHRDSGGAVVVEIEGLPTFLLQRSDGATLYHTRDLATIKYRMRTYHPSKIIYVVEHRQALHFQQLFALARRLNYVPEDVELSHIYFGTIFGADGKPLSTRQGNMLFLEALLDEAVQRVKDIVIQKAVERGVELPSEEREYIAESIGVGAVIYNDLYQDPRRNITLDWQRMLSFEGNSATYLQYTHARCQSVLRRAGDFSDTYEPGLLQHPSEIVLIRQLAQMPEAVREAALYYSPHKIATWLYSTARQFGVFYRDCSILEASSPELTTARLHLVRAVAVGLKGGLSLLGIKAPERM